MTAPLGNESRTTDRTVYRRIRRRSGAVLHNRGAGLVGLLLATLVAVSPTAHAEMANGMEEQIEFPNFGTIHVYRTVPRPQHIVLFISGDGGWNRGVVDMALALTRLDALVAGIDIRHYLKHLDATRQACDYPAADLEGLSQYLQKRYDYTDYSRPVLIGYSSGATMAYAALAQAPPGTFRGAISMGFCPDLPLTKPLCNGQGLRTEPGPRGKGYSFLPSRALAAPWIAFQGEIDQVCSAATVKSFVARTGDAEIVSLPKVGHGFSVQRNWLPQFEAAFGRIVQADSGQSHGGSGEVADLPLIEVQAVRGGGTLAVFLSGDGGWAGIDRSVAEALAADGVSVVGLDSLHYFWNARTPESAAGDLGRIIEHYVSAWHRNRVLLIGYSRGADVLPFMLNRLDAVQRQRVALVALIGSGQTTEFEFRLSDWLPGDREARYKVLPEVNAIKGTRLLCIYGADEAHSICRELDRRRFEVLQLRGGHHFNGDYKRLAENIVKAAR